LDGGSPTKTHAGKSSTQTKTPQRPQDEPQANSHLRDEAPKGRLEAFPETEAQERQTFAKEERSPKTAAGFQAGSSSETPQSDETQKSRRHCGSGVESSAEKEKSSGKNEKTSSYQLSAPPFECSASPL